MSGRKGASGLFLKVAITTMVIAVVGFFATIMLNVFVFDAFDEYGEVPVPGTASLHLPAGEATITFRTYTVGAPTGGGLPIPNLGLTIDPPAGVAEPKVTESFGSTASVNNDVRRRVWVVDIPAEGTYRITTDGNVSAFIEPRLAFGHASRLGWLPKAFAVLFALSVVDMIIVAVWRGRIKRAARPTPNYSLSLPDDPCIPSPVANQPADPYTPTDDGVRIEQLKTLAALRDSGALTADEFEAEKRRVLDSG